ncbi:MAG: oligosaccharide flippase family protein [Aerococcus sp.]|nr:oligosaccharide flippase family protein [Aerococcus sp.]
MKLLKNIISVALSNIVNFGTSFIIGFILPTILSVNDYGHYRTYTLYLSMVYLFNFGFADGIYIKYGGMENDELDRPVVHSEHTFSLIFQAIIFVLMLGYSLIQQNPILVLFSVVTFFTTMNTYHQNFLQATGNFKIYSTGSIVKSVIYVIMLMLAIFGLHSDNYLLYIVLNVLSAFVLFAYYEYHFYRREGWHFNGNLENKFILFRVGFLILIANMSLTFVGLIGNWVVKFGFSNETFAQYSFQNSILNVILLVVNAVGMVFYNLLAKNQNHQMIAMIKKLSLLVGIMSGLAFFIFKLIIIFFINKYTPSIELLSITFIAIPYIVISRILIANLYKTQRSEMQYIRDSILYATLSLLFVGGVYFMTHSVPAIAWATTLCYLLWYLYASSFQFVFMKTNWREIWLILSHILVFYVTANVLSTGVGMLVYAIYLCVVLWLQRDELRQVVTYLVNN